MRGSAWVALLVACAGKGSDDSAETEDSVPELPSLAEALDCGTLGELGGLGAGTDLQRLDLDTAVFPTALCNDGTGAFLYFRPHEGATDTDRWLIQFQGGGSCSGPNDCFNRWCSVDTNFGFQGMSNTASPAQGIEDLGILSRREVNPFGDFNQVFLRYCSSDNWAGSTTADAVGVHPVSGAEVEARIEFRGHDIVTAVLATLRQDGVDAPTYTLGGGAVALPDLDDAEIVVLAGASAGGNGTTLNADRIGEALRATNPGLAEFGALIDSAFPPSNTHFDYAPSVLCVEFNICDYETHHQGEHDDPRGGTVFRNMQDEASCVTFHTPTDDVWRCVDPHHVLEHHVTTPMMVRMGQADSSISGNLMDAGYGYEGSALDIVDFALLVQEDLSALADPAGNEEATSYTKNPAVFGPTCWHHDTLSNDAQVFSVTIDAEGEDLTMFQALGRWRDGGEPTVVIAANQGDNHCP